MLNSKVDTFPAIAVVAPADSVQDLATMTTSMPIPDGAKRLDRVRVVVLDGKVMIAIDSPQGPELIFREAITEILVEGKLVRVRTESDKAIAFTKDHNCGCGSRLRSWNPYGGTMYSTKDPT
jgi:hypothetical protein